MRYSENRHFLVQGMDIRARQPLNGGEGKEERTGGGMHYIEVTDTHDREGI